MKKVLLILITLLVAISGAVTGCTCEGGLGGSAEADGLEITVNRAYFGEVAGWESFLVEVTLRNTGDEGAFIHFAPFPNLFLQDSDGDTYKTMKAFTGWKESSTGEYQFPEGELDNISVEPNETKDLFLRFWDVPEDVGGLKLIYAKPKTEGGETRVPIPLEIEEAEPTEETTTPSQETHEGNVYTAAPENPQTPSEVVAAFWFWFSEGEYSKIENILAKARAEDLKEWPIPEKDREEIEEQYAAHPLQRIEIKDVDIREATAQVGCMLELGGMEDQDILMFLVREEGIWKVKGF
jgi:hypothetical protein